MKAKFRIEFLEQAVEFLESLEKKTKTKIIYNIDKASYVNDPKLFKKIDDEIWEFRTKYASKQYRMLAFWVKRKSTMSLVITTHGFVKKDSKVPRNEIKKANDLRLLFIKE